MKCKSAVLLVVLAFAGAGVAAAQTGAGGFRGTVTDEQGGALPGVTVTAASPEALAPAVAVTDGQGVYRLVNLPPGTYTITAELSGFAVFKREGLLLRAGATFQVNVQMKIGALEETITVSGESPMIEVSKPSNVLNIDGEFQKEMPIAARKNWSDFLELTPGVNARPFDDGSGRMVYFGHATEHFSHVVQLEGMVASNYNDAQLTYVQMGSDMIQDTQVKTGGVDASTPMGTGLAINVITKSGGNDFHGTGGYAFQPLRWNGDNTSASTTFNLPTELFGGSRTSTGGTPTQTGVKQVDASFGGPIKHDRVWFFGSFRYSNIDVGISRIEKQVYDMMAYEGAEPFNNKIQGYQPYVKVTARLTGAHELTGVFQRDRTNGTNNWEYTYDPIGVYANGGNLYSAKLTSVWGTNLTTTFLAGYNNKGGASASTYTWNPYGFDRAGPNIEIYEGTSVSGGLIRGNNIILEGGNLDTTNTLPASQILIRGDLTYFKEGWGGSHEFQTGFYAEPRNTYDIFAHYVNNGFYQERQTPVDVNDPSKGTIPFQRSYADPATLQTRKARDRDIGVYVQDTWKPGTRLTANIGLRLDFVKRQDKLFNVVREKSTEVQPRFGFSYLLTEDARNVIRGSWVRVPEQVNGRDAITSFGTGSKVSFVNEYDNNLDGVFETVVETPAVQGGLAAEEIDPNNHQPYVDEFILGYRTQLPWETSLDVAYINRAYKDMWGQVEINGYWPSGPYEPFGGFGVLDPDRGEWWRQTNNTWSQLHYQAIEITMAKNMSHNFQLMAGINRQWQHISGDWNPNDKAGFIAPDAFPNDKLIYQPRGNNDTNSLPESGNALSYGPTWRKYSMRFGGTYLAPYGITLSGSFTVQAGPWSGSPLYRLDPGDPDIAQFGPSTFTLANGTTAANPLSTRTRYVYATRGDGQIQAPAIKTVGLKLGKIFKLGASREVEFGATIFNLLNAGGFNQFSYNSAYQTWSTNFLQMRNRQPARALQITIVGRF
jgi:hypothetical protein